MAAYTTVVKLMVAMISLGLLAAFVLALPLHYDSGRQSGRLTTNIKGPVSARIIIYAIFSDLMLYT